MGYACPVCATPQRDGEHLANHLAFTAMLRSDDHESWLDDHVDDWDDRTPADLAAVVTDYAEEAEYDEVFEDTTGGHAHDHAHADPGRPDVGQQGGIGGVAEAVTDEAVQSVLEDAQELTEEMYGLREETDESEADGSGTGEGDDEDGERTDATADDDGEE